VKHQNDVQNFHAVLVYEIKVDGEIKSIYFVILLFVILSKEMYSLYILR